MPRPSSDLSEIAEERFDLTEFGRVALWAMLAVLAALAAVFAARSETGAQRITATLNGQPNPARTAAAGRAEAGNAALQAAEMRRLADSVRALAADRDRLLARLEALERSIEATGSIPPAERPAPAPPASREATSTSPPTADNPAPAAGRSTGNAQPLPQEAGVEATVTRTEFGLDLGAEPTLEGLRGLWSTLRAQHGPVLEGLRPVVKIRENPQTGTSELRLIAGPLTNAAAATRLCAVIGTTGRTCQPTAFEGQRLAAR